MGPKRNLSRLRRCGQVDGKQRAEPGAAGCDQGKFERASYGYTQCELGRATGDNSCIGDYMAGETNQTSDTHQDAAEESFAIPGTVALSVALFLQ